MCGLIASTSLECLEQLRQGLEKLRHRGPDQRQLLELDGGALGFQRLAIVGPGPEGAQPFVHDGTETTVSLVCNGEIYNEPALRQRIAQDYPYRSSSDCEVLVPLYLELGIEGLCRALDAEFALVLHDSRRQAFFAARDPIGIRPLFYGYDSESGAICCASEAKALTHFCTRVRPFPPGHYYDGLSESFVCYRDVASVDSFSDAEVPTITSRIRELLTAAVEKRLRADVPLGYLLSGGLDSSLVCSIAARLTGQPLRTFAIGIEEDPIDLSFARKAADHIGSDHTEVRFAMNDVFEALPDVIYHLESWDVTTVRAAIGMYLLCRHIRQHTDIKVLLTGEVSDELFGYKYTDFAPTPDAFQEEAARRVREIYFYDVLRADRSISAHALEARVPFGDLDFVDYVMQVRPEIKRNSYGIGKYLLRQAFARDNYLPPSLLQREKAAFSDAVGHSMVDRLQAFAESHYTDGEFQRERAKFTHAPPRTKEALLYRHLFAQNFPDSDELIPGYWMPNPSWPNCDVRDPSARVLPNYGCSGEPTQSDLRAG